MFSVIGALKLAAKGFLTVPGYMGILATHAVDITVVKLGSIEANETNFSGCANVSFAFVIRRVCSSTTMSCFATSETDPQ